ncbi:MAG: cache domain-containing protein [Candidatus Omnitrophica bacterium]|nr:cache domain-containing protein [Candidatus Omnitrophota bacterium]
MKKVSLSVILTVICFLFCSANIINAEVDYAEKRAYVKGLVDEAVELINAKGEEALSIIKQKDGKFYAQDTYVFITSAETGADLVNPVFEDIEGVPADSYPDSDSDSWVAQQIIVGAVRNKDEAWVEYYWAKPEETEPSKKVSYLRKININGKDRIVGAGFYPEDAGI